MAEFIGGNEEYISVKEPIVFENKTESQYEVCTGIVFHKSGIYEVSVVGNKTIVSEVPERKPGHWEWVQYDYNPKFGNWHCSECRSIVIECADKNEKDVISLYHYCPNCGAKIEVEE